MGNSKIVYYGETLIDLTGDTVEAAKLLKGVTAHDKAGEKITGTLSDVTQATPAITVDAAGKITASATQAAGVVAAGTKSATKQLTVQAGETVMPSSSIQTVVASQRFTTGDVKVAAVNGVIRISYPANSTLVVKGTVSGDHFAEDTNTTSSPKAYIFLAPIGNASYTLTATNSAGKTVSKKIYVAKDQVQSVVLAYELVIYDAGSFGKNSNGTAFDAKNTDDNNASSITKNSAYMLWECSANAWCIFYINPKVSCAGYKTLKISLTNASTNIDSGEGNGRWGLKSNNNYTTDGFVAQTNFTSLSGSRTLSLDVSNVGATAYYIAMQFGTPVNTGSFSARVTKIWFE